MPTETENLKLIARIANWISGTFYFLFILHWISSMFLSGHGPVPVSLDPKNGFGDNLVGHFLYAVLWYVLFPNKLIVGFQMFILIMSAFKKDLFSFTTLFLALLGILFYLNFFFFDVFGYFDLWWVD